MICSMTNLILDNVVCYNQLLYIYDIGFYPGLDFGLGLDSRGRGQTLEAEAEAKTLEAEAEAGDFGLEAEARPRGLTSLITGLTDHYKSQSTDHQYFRWLTD